MKKATILMIAIVLSCSVFSQNTYKYVINKRGEPFDLVQDIDTISADSAGIPLTYVYAGDTSLYPVPEKAGDIFIDTTTPDVYIFRC